MIMKLDIRIDWWKLRRCTFNLNFIYMSIKKFLLWTLPVVMLLVGFYAGSMYQKPAIKPVEENKTQENNSSVTSDKKAPLFTFETPAGYEGKIENNSSSLWKEGRAKPTGDSDAQPDLVASVGSSDISGSLFSRLNPVVLRSLMVSGYDAKYYKLTDDFGDSYAVIVDAKGQWIYIESIDQNLLDKVLATFKINK